MSTKKEPEEPRRTPVGPSGITSPEQRKIELRPTEDTFDVYGNFADVNWTLHDLTVRVGQITPSIAENGNWIAEEKVRVSFAWAYAKVLNQILSSLIANYERVNGEIKRPQLAPALDPSVVAALVKGAEGTKPH